MGTDTFNIPFEGCEGGGPLLKFAHKFVRATITGKGLMWRCHAVAMDENLPYMCIPLECGEAQVCRECYNCFLTEARSHGIPIDDKHFWE
jgi:hypothetical protein